MNYENKYVKYKTKYNKLLKDNMIGGNKDDMKEIYFIRHGQTLWNELGKTQGQEADIELSEKGKEESIKTGKYLKKYRSNDKKFDCIISSPMIRCRETSKVIRPKYSYWSNVKNI